MATIHVSGTQLAEPKAQVPLNKKFLLALAILFLVAMHFFMPNPGGAGLALSFNPTTWIAFSFVFALGCNQLASQQYLRYSKLTIGLFVSCLILTVPLFYANSHYMQSVSRLVGLWAGFGFFVLLQQFSFSNKHKQRLLWLVVLAVVIESFIGYYQFLWLKPGNWMGYDTLSNRPYGIFQQPNVMASFLATGLIISGYLLARQPHKYNKHLSEITLLYLIPLLTVPLIVVLASRTGWLTAMIATLLLLPYLYRFGTKIRFWGWLGAIILGLSLSGALLQSTESNLAGQKTNLESARAYTFPQALDMLIEKPFTGYGYGNFESAYTLYTARQHLLNKQYPPALPAMDHPHNELLYWGVEGGLVPLLGIFLAAILVLNRIYSAKKGTRLAMFALFVPIVLHSQLEYPFYHSAAHWLIFIILIYWVDQRVAKVKSVSFSRISKTALRVASLVVPILTTFYMLSALHTNYVLTKFETTRPVNPDLLQRVTNPVVWKDRFDWDVYSTYLNIGLATQDAKLIQPYIDWSLEIIKTKPRPAFYSNLILAYQGLGDLSKAEQVKAEAEFLFPKNDFSNIHYQPPSAALSNSVSSSQ
ncbi:PglL family O-oligosaccharyltransferase [Vibrio vulnificus]|nr:PglL family O-oligosaccharyltransferase [Vibrio vulnificus]EKZ9057507.1 PglL family O-oligosaccharyltransferase [Vibrio vulnificus]MCU8395765.1 PglL family O-oligosaccharyltransferase [Vibrio vulnificus]MCU8539553.1 PglL family O-oligosaccharyltransferase [Vibrio vulnificus]MCU8544739.1 PglL family O-oligosaccharyltransferase [Vibrio vulnificus]